MRSWWPALRLARREARRAKGRSSLVLAMIALPVAFLSFLAVSFDMFTLSKQEEVTRRLGAADALITWVSQEPIHQSPAGFGWSAEARPQAPVTVTDDAILTRLPPGSRVLREAESQVVARTPGGLAVMAGKITDLADPMVRGMATLLEGQAPATAGEIALSREAAKRLGAGVGDRVTLVDPAGFYRVSGIVEYPSALVPIVVLPPGTAAAMPSVSWLVSVPGGVDWPEVVRLNAFGMHVYSRKVNLDPRLGSDFGSELPPVRELALSAIVAGLAILEIVLLCGPAFAVGARRRARELAVIAAAGARPHQLRRIVLADGLVLGFGGAIGGLVLGVGLACAARPLLEQLAVHSRAGGWRFFPLALLGIVGLAVGTGLLAAMVPAWTAARQDVVSALSGRRGIIRSRRRWIVTGAAVAFAGMAIASAGAVGSAEEIILMGLVLLELGLVLITPALIGFVARAGRWLPLAPRLALRGAARHRSSAAPAISAVMAAVAGAVAAGVFSAGTDQQEIDRYQPALPPGHVGIEELTLPGQAEADWARALDVTRGALPSARVATIQTADEVTFLPAVTGYRSARPWMWSIVDDGTALPAVTGADAADIEAAREMLAAGGVVVTDPLTVADGQITLIIDDTCSLTLPAYALTTGTPGVALVISPAAVARLGLTAHTRGLVAQTTSPPSADDVERLRLGLADLSPTIQVQVESGPSRSTSPIQLILGLAAAAIALGAAAIATGLAAADSQPDLATLAAVGANPALRRKLSLSQAGLIAGLGAILGTLTGLGTAAALIVASNQLSASFDPPVPFVIPWTSIAIVIAAPLLAMAGAGLLTRSGLPIERRF